MRGKRHPNFKAVPHLPAPTRRFPRLTSLRLLPPRLSCIGLDPDSWPACRSHRRLNCPNFLPAPEDWNWSIAAFVGALSLVVRRRRVIRIRPHCLPIATSPRTT
jgi:hypothetical protein